MNKEIEDIINSFDNILIFSGAGVSTLSGIPDYKSSDLYWSDIKKDYFTHQEIMSEHMFIQDKELFYTYYSDMLESFKDKEPNKTHMLAKLMNKKHKLNGVITQNIDGLYKGLIPDGKLCEIHGNAFIYTCTKCGKELNTSELYKENGSILYSICCNKIAKPSVVLYGEPFHETYIDNYLRLLDTSDCIVVMGTELDIAYHNQSIGNSNAFKVLINKDIITIKKLVNSGYSKNLINVNWDAKFIGGLQEYL